VVFGDYCEAPIIVKPEDGDQQSFDAAAAATTTEWYGGGVGGQLE
jgi:hypothetical protein